MEAGMRISKSEFDEGLIRDIRRLETSLFEWISAGLGNTALADKIRAQISEATQIIGSH